MLVPGEMPFRSHIPQLIPQAQPRALPRHAFLSSNLLGCFACHISLSPVLGRKAVGKGRRSFGRVRVARNRVRAEDD
jgi:hypothetical protein